MSGINGSVYHDPSPSFSSYIDDSTFVALFHSILSYEILWSLTGQVQVVALNVNHGEYCNRSIGALLIVELILNVLDHSPLIVNEK